MRNGRRHPLRAGALFLLFAGLVLALPAEAGATWVIKGRGYGHGVGMSQYGAYGFAVHGKGYRYILRHYYRGTHIGKLRGPHVVRVLLRIAPGNVVFSGAKRSCGRRLRPNLRYVAELRGSTVQLYGAGGRHLENCGHRLRAGGRRRIRIGGLGPWHGALEVVPTSSSPGSLNVINAVAVNQYVKGVVPHEVPYTWPMAALEAQAVAARSIALSATVDGNGFDLYGDTRTQAYINIDGETPRTTRAAAKTRGRVVKYHGEVALCFYFSTSGGHTENVENSFFSGPIPYLKGVRDPYDYYSPLHKWRLVLSNAEMNSHLAPYVSGNLRQIVVTKRGVSPRIIWARLYGTGGVSRIRGDTLQYALGAYDRWMHFRRVR